MEYEKLCRAVEQHLHREMHTPADFEYLSEKILGKTGDAVSSTTLMRLWGYRRPSGNVRVSTLDILARFIDYEDYTHFRTEAEKDSGTLTTPSPTEKAGKGYVRWIIGMLLALLVAVVLSLFYFHRPQEQSQPRYITHLSELKNNRQYLIHTREQRRGSLGICGRHLGATFDKAVLFHCDKASPFAIIQHEGNYYLFSIQKGRFVNILNYLTDEPLRKDFGKKNWCAFDIHQEKFGFVFNFKSTNNTYTLNVAAFDGIINDDWGTTNGIYDDGNQFTLEDIGPFDPTEALSYLIQDSCTVPKQRPTKQGMVQYTQ